MRLIEKSCLKRRKDMAYIIGGAVAAAFVIMQLYMMVAAGDREFDLEDAEQENFMKEWRAKHDKTK